MATLLISLVTNYPPSQINNIDILLVNRNNINESHFRIMSSFPDNLNLRDGKVLTKFGPLEIGTYQVTLRMFFNQAPFVLNRFAHASIGEGDNDTTIVITAPE